MQQRLAMFVLASVAAIGCGDNTSGPPAEPDAAAPPPIDAPPTATCDEARLADTLGAIPGVISAVEQPCGPYVIGAARCFAIEFDQPIQHASPQGAHFAQALFLVHRGCDEPTVVADWGYSNDMFFDDELSYTYRANNLWIEHRYQGVSVPSPSDWDWTALTIENGATDMHSVIAGFRTHYAGRWVSTGASKGGITASYHRYFFPDDLDGSIPYVAPGSRLRIDPEYQNYLDTTLDFACANHIRTIQTQALTTRRTMMLNHLTPLVGAGNEPAYLDQLTALLDWGFWQYWGYSHCGDVPNPATATNSQFWQFYLDYSFLGFRTTGAPSPTPGGSEMSWGALSYEWLTEQGFALQIGEHVRPLLTDPSATATMEDDFRDAYPSVTLPAHDPTVTLATRAWVRDGADTVLLIYGEYDPWSGGAMEPPTHASSGRFFAPAQTHGGAGLDSLTEADQTAAFALATPMFGKEPMLDNKPAARLAGMIRDAMIRRQELRYWMTALQR